MQSSKRIKWLLLVLCFTLGTFAPALANAPRSQDSDLIKVFAESMAGNESDTTEKPEAPAVTPETTSMEDHPPAHFKAVVFKAVHSANGLMFLTFISALFLLCNLMLSAYTWVNRLHIGSSQEAYWQLSRNAPYKVIIAGFINLLAGGLGTIILLKAAPILGFLFGAWYVEKLVRSAGMAVSFSIAPQEDLTLPETCTDTFLHTLCFTSISFIPLYGQYFLLKQLLTGLGVLVLSSLSSSPTVSEKTERKDVSPENTDQKESGEKPSKED